MNALSATTVAGATATAALAAVLVLAMLSRPPPLSALSLSESHSPRLAPPGATALLPAAPMLDDCARFAPADPAFDTWRNSLLLAKGDASPPASDSATNDRSDLNDRGCDPDGGSGLGPEIGGLGSGWIISADGVMQMNPYSLSDTHSITVRPTEPLLEFKGRVIGLGAETVPQGTPPVPEEKERRPLLVVRDRAGDPPAPLAEVLGLGDAAAVPPARLRATFASVGAQPASRRQDRA